MWSYQRLIAFFFVSHIDVMIYFVQFKCYSKSIRAIFIIICYRHKPKLSDVM